MRTCRKDCDDCKVVNGRTPVGAHLLLMENHEFGTEFTQELPDELEPEEECDHNDLDSSLQAGVQKGVQTRPLRAELGLDELFLLIGATGELVSIGYPSVGGDTSFARGLWAVVKPVCGAN